MTIRDHIAALQTALDKRTGLKKSKAGTFYSTPARLHTTQRMRRMQNGEGDASEDGGPRSSGVPSRDATASGAPLIAIAPTHETLN